MSPEISTLWDGYRNRRKVSELSIKFLIPIHNFFTDLFHPRWLLGISHSFLSSPRYMCHLSTSSEKFFFYQLCNPSKVTFNLTLFDESLAIFLKNETISSNSRYLNFHSFDSALYSYKCTS